MEDILGLVVGTVLTLIIFSYLLGDNALYRWALALLVGSTAGYALGLAVREVLTNWILPALGSGSLEMGLAYIVPLLLGCLLLLKGFPPTRFLGRISVIGNIPLGYLVGVGAGVAVAGALMGTLIPQVLSTGEAVQIGDTWLGLVQGVLIVVGTIATLLAFTMRPRSLSDAMARRFGPRGVGIVGRTFLVVALGTVFSGAITSALTAMVLRLWQMAELFRQLIPMVGG